MMEELEPIPIRKYKNPYYRFRFKIADRHPNDVDKQEGRMLGIFCTLYATAAVTAIALSIAFQTEPSYHERLVKEVEEYTDCVNTSLGIQQMENLKTHRAYPQIKLDPEVVEVIEICREEHPMPNK